MSSVISAETSDVGSLLEENIIQLKIFIFALESDTKVIFLLNYFSHVTMNCILIDSSSYKELFSKIKQNTTFFLLCQSEAFI